MGLSIGFAKIFFDFFNFFAQQNFVGRFTKCSIVLLCHRETRVKTKLDFQQLLPLLPYANMSYDIVVYDTMSR